MYPIQEHLVEWLKGEGAEYARDPDHLRHVSLFESDTFNITKCNDLYQQYVECGLLTFDEESKISSWVGPDKISFKGRQIGYLRLIFGAICELGVPRNYIPRTEGTNSDVTPRNLYLERYEGAKEIPYSDSFFPFINPNTPRKFGTLSPSEIWDRMLNVSEKNPLERWQLVQELSIYRKFVVGHGGDMECAIGRGDDETRKYPVIKHRVRENRGTVEQYECWLFNKDNWTTHVLSVPLKIMLKNQAEEHRVVRLHHFMWKLVFGWHPTDRKGELNTCPNKWCINPFHYQFNKK